MSSFSLKFSLHFGENFFVGSGRKYLGLTIYFLSSPSSQTHFKKFFFPFSHQNFSSIQFHFQTNTPLVLIFFFNWTCLFILKVKNIIIKKKKKKIKDMLTSTTWCLLSKKKKRQEQFVKKRNQIIRAVNEPSRS